MRRISQQGAGAQQFQRNKKLYFFQYILNFILQGKKALIPMFYVIFPSTIRKRNSVYSISLWVTDIQDLPGQLNWAEEFAPWLYLESRTHRKGVIHSWSTALTFSLFLACSKSRNGFIAELPISDFKYDTSAHF